MTQAVTVVPVDARTPDWPRKVATVLNRLQNTTALAGGTAAWGSITGTLTAQTDLQGALDAKQATLVSGTNIKTVNSTSLLGSGNITTGTVTSVAASVPTGFQISGSPVTASGTLAITFASGYSLPSDATQANWTTAFGWGNHASAGYLTTAAAAAAYQPLDAQLTDLAGLSYAGNANKVVRVNAGATGFELATVSGGGGLSDGDYGDITVGGGGTTLTVDNDAITYAKMQNVSATSRILGRKTASAGDAEECTLSEVLDFIGSAAQGDILYRGASSWARLGAGTSGRFLKTQGTGANPTWGAPWDFSPPTAASFSLASGDATNLTLTDDNDVGLMIDPGAPVSGEITRFAYRTLTTPANDWVMTAKILPLLVVGNHSSVGIMARDSASGRHAALMLVHGGTLDVNYRTLSTYSSAPLSWSTNYKMFWLQIEKSGSNLLYKVSPDGKNWETLLTASATAWMTSVPNQVGLFTHYNRTTGARARSTVPYFALTGTAV